jgi:hypothetical protein
VNRFILRVKRRRRKRKEEEVMGNAREIRRSNETALGPAPTEPPALPPRPLVENIPSNSRVIENQDAGNKIPTFSCLKKKRKFFSNFVFPLAMKSEISKFCGSSLYIKI